MARDIAKFIEQLSDYINNYIVGTENTCITKCINDGTVTNRGHAIPLEVKLPEDIDTGVTSYCPTYYAEELIEEFPNHTPAGIAEIVNVRITQHYPAMMQMLREQAKSMDKTIDDYTTGELVVTAQPTANHPDALKEEYPFIVKEVPEIGITMCLKALLCEAPDNNNQVYVAPVLKSKTNDVTEAQWDDAKYNSLANSELHCMLTKPQGFEFLKFPICGELMDMKSFYDYFYLLSPEEIWKGIAEETDSDRIYIIPLGAEAAAFVLDSKKIRSSAEATAASKGLLITADEIQMEGMPMFVFDRATSQLTKYELEWHEGEE